MGIREKKTIGKSGLASVRLLKKSAVIRFDDDDVYEMPLENWGEQKGGDYIVTLSQDSTKVLSVRPPAGTYIVQFKQMGHRLNDMPTSKIQRGGRYQRKDGKGVFDVPDRLIYVVELEVVSDGIYRGLSFTMNMNYAFQPATSGPFTDIVDSKYGLEKSERFYRAIGAGNIATLEIPFSDNVLPWLEKYLLNHRKPFSVTTNEKGFVDEYAELPDGLFNEPKKKSKK